MSYKFVNPTENTLAFAGLVLEPFSTTEFSSHKIERIVQDPVNLATIRSVIDAGVSTYSFVPEPGYFDVLAAPGGNTGEPGGPSTPLLDNQAIVTDGDVFILDGGFVSISVSNNVVSASYTAD